MKRERPIIVMANEGTYPFVGGGVSTWCDQLCSGLDDVDYIVLAVTGDQTAAWQYARPDCIVRVAQVPQWPGEEPTVYTKPGPFKEVLKARWATTEESVKEKLVPHMRTILREIFIGEVEINELLDALVGAGVFFRQHEYKAAMRTQAIWEELLRSVHEFVESDAGRHSEEPTVEDLTTCGRWMYNMMMPICFEIEDEYTIFHATIAASCALPGIIDRKIKPIRMITTDHGVYLRERYINISAGISLRYRRNS